MTALPIFRTDKPTRRFDRLQPMSRVDALAWKLTRERMPHLYRKDER
jgi:hypothetical protein